MTEITIEVSDLRKKDADKVQELAKFLEERLSVEVTKDNDSFTIGDSAFPKTYIRVVVQKFLHKEDLKERFRLISKEGNIVVKKRKEREE